MKEKKEEKAKAAKKIRRRESGFLVFQEKRGGMRVTRKMKASTRRRTTRTSLNWTR